MASQEGSGRPLSLSGRSEIGKVARSKRQQSGAARESINLLILYVVGGGK